MASRHYIINGNSVRFIAKIDSENLIDWIPSLRICTYGNLESGSFEICFMFLNFVAGVKVWRETFREKR